MSQALIWEVIKNNHSALRKAKNATFSTEKGNLLGLHAFKFSGFANEKVVDISAAKKSKKDTKGALGLVMSVKSTKAAKANKPAKAFNVLALKKGSRRSVKTVSKLIEKYRPDLKKTALIRVSKLYRGLNNVKKAPAAAAKN
eukprot:CAMPEP_0184691350 /NCGR_PEP_ID=MMETSP0313-20130426/241_1 /TAXON_ID=2792 /ORGANISM="Porphyridium aerugineum, Strain SAG 1380-2" /LENGTH=141 /DNA_ID=CAMNT_0027149047 /DNA_START=95 /DNA_END=520 /DNA_ORIENTATION=+